MTHKTTTTAVIHAEGRRLVEQIDLVFDRAEPLLIRMVFTLDGNTWEVSRDLLRAACAGEHAGLGDVRIWLVDGYVRVVIASPDGRAVVDLPADATKEFLADTLRSVPRSRERVDVDRAIALTREDA